MPVADSRPVAHRIERLPVQRRRAVDSGPLPVRFGSPFNALSRFDPIRRRLFALPRWSRNIEGLGVLGQIQNRVGRKVHQLVNRHATLMPSRFRMPTIRSAKRPHLIINPGIDVHAGRINTGAGQRAVARPRVRSIGDEENRPSGKIPRLTNNSAICETRLHGVGLLTESLRAPGGSNTSAGGLGSFPAEGRRDDGIRNGALFAAPFSGGHENSSRRDPLCADRLTRVASSAVGSRPRCARRQEHPNRVFAATSSALASSAVGVSPLMSSPMLVAKALRIGSSVS